MKFRGAIRGLGPRPKVEKPDWGRIYSPKLRELWAAGVTTKEIAIEMGVKQHSISACARRLGLPERTNASMTMRVYRQQKAIEAMRKRAQDAQAEIARRGLADGVKFS